MLVVYRSFQKNNNNTKSKKLTLHVKRKYRYAIITRIERLKNQNFNL